MTEVCGCVKDNIEASSVFEQEYFSLTHPHTHIYCLLESTANSYETRNILKRFRERARERERERERGK